jgi:hypothetical protein
MPDPTGRWLNATQWQCPKCAWVNASDRERCEQCNGSVRPPKDEPVRPPDPLDLISHGGTPAPGPGELAAKAVHSLTRVTRDRAASLFGENLHRALTKRGKTGDRAWQAITEMPENDRRAALDSLVDDLEEGGFALYRIDEDGRS